jgi:hypothetical protein
MACEAMPLRERNGGKVLGAQSSTPLWYISYNRLVLCQRHLRFGKLAKYFGDRPDARDQPSIPSIRITLLKARPVNLSTMPRAG